MDKQEQAAGSVSANNFSETELQKIMQAEKDLYDITHILQKEKIVELQQGFHLSTVAYFQGYYFKVWFLAEVTKG